MDKFFISTSILSGSPFKLRNIFGLFLIFVIVIIKLLYSFDFNFLIGPFIISLIIKLYGYFKSTFNFLSFEKFI